MKYHRPIFAIFVQAALLPVCVGLNLSAAIKDPDSLASMEDVAQIPAGQAFRLDREGGKFTFGNPESIFVDCKETGDITFDISNNKMLGNMGLSGQLKYLTVYRDSYRACSNPKGFNGVWTAKDLSNFGPYNFGLEIGRGNGTETINLDEKLDWDFRLSLLDNIFPFAELKDPKGRFTVQLLAFAPVSADGSQRPRGFVYHLWLKNTGAALLEGRVQLPKLFAGNRGEGNWARKELYEFEFGLADNGASTQSRVDQLLAEAAANQKPLAPASARSQALREITQNGLPFSLKPGETLSVPYVLYMPADNALEEINTRGELAWFNDTWRYNRSLLGRVTTPSRPWLGELYERQLLQALQSLTISESGRLSGSNWGSYPATRQTWAKDCFYSALPLVALDPMLARPIIQWFHENGVRHPGNIVEGGLNHSISLTVSSLMLAGDYYEHTGDASLFRDNPGWRKDWEERLDGLQTSRAFPDIELYPTRFISDGELKGDFHCGSNIAVWHALKSFSRLLAEVYQDPAAAKRYADRARRMKEDILKYCVINGRFGKQFIEGINRDGTVPTMTSDGEESETTLIPYYGFLPNDDATYLNYMRFSMSPENIQYTPQTRSINWGKNVPSTAPGYNKGLCAGITSAELFGEHGYYSEIRRVLEADGSMWWWPVKLVKNDGSGAEARVEAGKVDGAGKPADSTELTVPKRGPGKAGWFAGVHSLLFRSRFAGLEYDAPSHTLNWQPLPAFGDFAWQDLPFGHERFSVRLAWSEDKPHAVLKNPNKMSVNVRLTLPAKSGQWMLNDAPLTAKAAESFGAPGQTVEFQMAPGTTADVSVTPDGKSKDPSKAAPLPKPL